MSDYEINTLSKIFASKGERLIAKINVKNLAKKKKTDILFHTES